MNQVLRRPSANRDLVSIFRYYRYYACEAGLRVADRFFAEAEATFARLADIPGMGTRYQPDEPCYAELLFFPVSRFQKYLVFYRPIPGGIEVLRVLHGARDIASLLTEEFEIEKHAEADEDE